LPSASIAQWKKAGYLTSDLARRDGFAALIWRLLFDISVGGISSTFQSQLQKLNMTAQEAANDQYKLLATRIVDDVVARHGVAGLKFTGHSLGGALASLMAMYAEDKLNHIADTVTFSAPGVRCLSNDRNWYGDKARPQITNYYSLIDIIPAAGYAPGKMCPFLPEAGRAQCAPIFGFGIELYADTYRYNLLTQCNKQSHDFFAMYEEISLRDDRITVNGDTNFGCFLPDYGTCPTYAAGADYVFFIIFLIVIIVSIVVGIVIGIIALVRLCYLSANHRYDKIFPCCRCCKCGRCCGPTKEEYFFGGTEMGQFH